MLVILVEKPVKDFIGMNKLLFLFLILLVIGSCKDEDNTNADFFSPVQVYLSINLNLPAYTNLSLPQGYVYESGGNKGIIIYHTIFNEYVAFDRTCPLNPTDACSYVSVDSTNSFYRCGHYTSSWQACCNSKFDPANGSVLSGSAKRALKQYYVRQDGSTLIITNTP